MAPRIKAKQQLQNFMDYYGLTPPELACRMSPPIERQTVVRWCDGTRRPSVEYQQQLFEMSDRKIKPSGWLTAKELAKEKIKTAWFKKYPVQAKDGDVAEKQNNAKSNKNNGQKLVSAKNGSSKNSNGQSAVSEHSVGSVHGADSEVPASNTPALPIKRKPGRPKGSKNRPLANVHAAGDGVHEGSDGTNANKTRAGNRARSVRTSPTANSKSGKSGESSESTGDGEAIRTIQAAIGTGASHLRLVDSGSASSAAGSADGGESDRRDESPECANSEIETQTSVAGSKTHEDSQASDETDTKAAVIVQPTGPIRKNHSECSSDDPMTRMQMRKDGAIAFELVDAAGFVLCVYQDVVSARNALDSRIYPTSHAARCKFCWTEVSVYAPPRPEITERLARSVTEAQPRNRGGRDGNGRESGERDGRERDSSGRENGIGSRTRREDRENGEEQDVIQ